VLTPAQVGKAIRVIVTATNAAGRSSAASAATRAVSASAPAATALPAISGTAAAGRVLTASTGSWSGTVPMTYGYRWQRCNATGASCVAVPGATGRSYTVSATDVKRTLRVVIAARNGAGSAAATSAQTPVVTPR